MFYLKLKELIIFILVVISAILIVKENKLRKELQNWKDNYEIEVKHNEAILKRIEGSLAIYETKAHEMALKEFTKIYKPWVDSLQRLGLKKISTIEKVVAEMNITQNVKTIDTLDSLKTWTIKMPSIQIKTIELSDTDRHVEIKQNISLTITRSLKQRKGIIRKIFLIPIRREPVYSVIPADSTIHITNFQVFELN